MEEKKLTPEEEAARQESEETESTPQAEGAAGEPQEAAAQEPQTGSPQPEGTEAEAPRESAQEPEAEAGKSRQDRKAKKAGKIDKEKEAMREQVAQLEDRVKRQLAEFENFRTRTDREKAQMFDMGARSVLEKLLPVIDNFERGLASVPEEGKSDPFVDGMNMVYRQMMTEMEKLGVTPIEAVGQPFDPNLHNAVMQTQSEEYESGTVAQELQKGYRFHDAVLRHSMVSVVE
ncbi:MAG: nucleotide exchange factor GrpE [Lachnospiraceae bacterium]|nr:nucleotide exchange factor GrpE [Lachnospiraceae bacterium]